MKKNDMKKIVKQWICICLAFLVAIPALTMQPTKSSAAAVTMLADDFEGQELGTGPDAAKWSYNPTVTPAGAGTTSATVVENVYGNHVMELHSILTSGGSRNVNSTMKFPLTGSRNDTLIDLSLKLSFGDWSKVNGTPILQIYSGSKRMDSSTLGWQDLLKFYSDSNGKGTLKFEFDKLNPVTVINEINKDEWYDIRIVSRAADNNGAKMNVADIYLNGDHHRTITIPASSLYGYTAYQIVNVINQTHTNFAGGNLRFSVDDIRFVQNPDEQNPDAAILAAPTVAGDVDMSQPMTVQFNRPMDAKAITTAGNFKLNGDASLIASVSLDAADASKAVVVFNVPAGQPQDYTLSLSELKDFYGNVMPTQELTFRSKAPPGFFVKDFYFYKNDRNLFALETGQIRTEIRVENFTDAVRSVTLSVARYNGAQLEDTLTEEVALQPQTSENVVVSMPIVDTSGERYIEASLIDGVDGTTQLLPKVKLDRYSAYWHEEDYDFFLLPTIDRSLLRTPEGLFTELTDNAHGHFERPDTDEIISTIENYSQGEHPRILATDSTFQMIKDNLNTDAYIKLGHQSAIAAADALLNTPVIAYAMTENPIASQRNLVNDYQVPDYMMKLGYAYQMTGDSKYAERAWLEAQNIMNYPDWGNKHQGQFLGTSQLAFGMAIAYDWFYEYWTDEQKKQMRDKIIQNVLRPGMMFFSIHGLESSGIAFYMQTEIGNWNQVPNAGMLTAALAIFDEEQELAARVIENTTRSLEWGTKIYEPDGAYEEGVGYWAYGTGFMINAFSSLKNTAGTLFGLDEAPGLTETPLFLMYFRGPGGAFNYGDANEDAKTAPTDADMHWFATHYDDQDIYTARMYTPAQRATATIKDLVYYEPGRFTVDFSFPLDAYFEGSDNSVGSATFRSSFADSNATFLGFHAGTNNIDGHPMYDAGSFILDALGQRWALDVGDGRRDGTSYFSMSGTQFYRKRTEGHNTIVINPDAGVGQDMYDTPTLVEYQSKPKGGMMITDMTALYDDQISASNTANFPNVATSVYRGTMYDRLSDIVTVQDEITTASPATIYWFMHTRAGIEISEDGRSAILTQGGKQLQAMMSGAEGAVFSIMEAKLFPLESPPYPQVNMPNDPLLKKLTIKLENVTDVDLAVTFKPLPTGTELFQAEPAMTPLDEWAIPEGDINQLSLTELKLNGEPIEGFDGEKTSYDVILSPNATEAPVVTAQSDYPITIMQADGVPGTASITISDSDIPGRTATISIQFDKFMKFEDSLDFSGVLASAVPEVQNTPRNTIDGSLTTGWTAQGEQWIRYDLGSVKQINGTAVAWGSGNVRQALFDLEVSEDGVLWSHVYAGPSSGTTLELELYEFEPVSARYVRIAGHGNSSSAWNSVREVRVKGVEVQAPSLSERIASAQQLHDAATEGIQNGQYPIGSKARLTLAVAEAVAVHEDSAAGAEQQESAILKLDEAVARFEQLVITAATGDVNDVPGVDFGDLNKIVENYGVKKGDAKWAAIRHADLNGDDRIGLYELAFISYRLFQ
jgi:hypothetical protein